MHRARHVRLLASAIALSVPFAVYACSSDDTRECRIGADCASGICAEDGRCIRQDGPGTGPDGAPIPAPVTDGGPELTDATLLDAALPGCKPNNDGTITRDEVPLQAGLRATYKVATNPTEVNSTAGIAIDGGNRRLWDYAGTFGSDQSVLVETLPLAGKWYGPKFVGATYATRLTQASDLLGVFEVSGGGITLRGVVSPQDGDKRTELSYGPAPAVLAFPLQVGAKWKTTSSLTGVAPAQAGGTAYSVDGNATETYEAEADFGGQLKTPFGTFEVIRVKTVLVRKLSWLGWPVSNTTVRSYAWVTECFGTVASATSTENETADEFRPAELRRLAP